MAEKKKQGEYTLSYEELSSNDMVFLFLTILESRGYHGFIEMMSVLDNPGLVIKLLCLFYGLSIQFPPLEEVEKCLKATEYVFTDMHKKINDKLVAKPLDIRNHMNLTEEEEQEILDIFDNWTLYMAKNGHDPRSLFHINRNNTKKRMEMTIKGKKWAAKKY